VRRAKLYYLRGKVGKSARVAERRWGIEEEMVVAEEEAEAVDAEGVAVSEAEAEVTDPIEEEAEQAAEGEEPTEGQEPTEGDERGADGGETAEAESEPGRKPKADASPDEAED